MITGDIVYSRGRISEYREKFWPVYNADMASPLSGHRFCVPACLWQPLATTTLPRVTLASIPTASPISSTGISLVMVLPAVAAASPVPPLIGPEANQKAFIQAAGDAYPRMASFSFDYGNAHWTVLDSNPYVDWTNHELRAWVAHDLANAQAQHVAICRLPSSWFQFLQGALWRSAYATSG